MNKELTLQLRFTAPAFLGGASGGAECRSFPLKALYRTWWRVAWCAGRQPDVPYMRQVEGELFGHSWLKNPNDSNKTWSLKSPVQFVLEQWTPGTMQEWPKDPPVKHPEVDKPASQLVGAHLYLGYGPLSYLREKGTAIKNKPALSEGTKLSFSLRFPEDLEETLCLQGVTAFWQLFGTLGSRSRNGWGSFQIAAPESGIPTFGQLKSFCRPWEECLKQDWSHAIGMDTQGWLVWKAKAPCRTWSEGMKVLAETKIGFRTALAFQSNNSRNQVIEDRHFLAYPVTNHPVRAWGGQSRLANQLVMKLLLDSAGYWPLVAHLPHGLPQALASMISGPGGLNHLKQLEAWCKVHEVLDGRMSRMK